MREIRTFFSDFRVVDDGVKRGTSKGHPSGVCYVIFDTKEEASKALNSKNMKKMGTRYIEIFNSDERELEVFLNLNFSENKSPSYHKDK